MDATASSADGVYHEFSRKEYRSCIVLIGLDGFRLIEGSH